MVKYIYGHTRNGRRSIKQSRSKRSVRFAVFQNVRVSSFEDILKNGCNVLIGFAFAPGEERCFMSIIEVLTLGILICDIIKILLESKKK